ncbi:MAG TPA: aminotransferase class I/II-fold pyridoxal phosphate-dependent enzyme [Victivallales bacterium]|nr:aminotransferase class I/II-fold pyridoxal phosphate-dependent enzyme [Victivallales bacterium]
MKKFDPEQALSEVKREFGEHGGVAPSISRASTFTVMDAGTMPDIFEGLRTPKQDGCYLYSRHFNPTVNILDRYLAAIDDTEAALSTASGMSAISCSILQICRVGDHIVASNTIYGGTHALFNELFREMGIHTTFVDPADNRAFEAAITPKTKIIFTETVSNPTLKVADIPGISKIAHKHNLKLIVDNTFTPMIISPARLGADIVVYSMTKFINGASDLLAGAVCASKEFINELMDLHTGRVMLLGPTIDPRVAFDLIQRIPHLGIRMREHSRRGIAVSEKLQDLGVSVSYPGLKEHAQHKLFTSMMNEAYGYGGIITIDCKTKEKAHTVMSELQNAEHFGLMAVSLGYFDTLMSCSSSSTSSEISDRDQAEMGLSHGLLRISIGITGALEFRIEQIERAVKKLLI